MCRACNHPAYDGEPTCRDLDAETAELLRHDQTKPRHIYPCGMSGCWACDHIYTRTQEAS